ncbi:MAG: caspase domain-containing protein [Sterolibacteriaceae bacterium MAG5]|nr:caspase domain-containing protein [Candidatus Nitricoxidireducens bremensis]
MPKLALPIVRCILLLSALFAGLVHGAERRVALVIGNAAYPGAPLANPANDARDMAAALRKLGFEVIEKTNAGQKEMNRAIAQFGEKLRADTVALFFYAGHGMQIKGKNYLIPIDAQIASEASARVETVDVDGVLDQLAVSPLNIVILDACRNNPFERRFRSAGGGLAQMDAPKGSLIAYATAPGKVASDGSGRNGLYTQEILKHIQTPGLPLEAVFKRVRNGVMAGSGDAQTPWESSSLTGDFYFVAGSAGTPPPQASSPDPGAAAARTPQQIEDELWDTIRNSDKAGVFDEYLKGYPDGRYAVQARIRLTELGTAAAARPVTAPAAKPPDVAGIWHWAVRSIFVADRVNTVNADGTCTLNTGTTCVWSSEPGRRVVFRFSDTWTHKMTLSDDGRSMKGTDDWGTAVTATKAGTP